MTLLRIGVACALLMILGGLAVIYSNGKSARAAEPTANVFSEEESLHRYATSQTRHWRHLMIKKN